MHYLEKVKQNPEHQLEAESRFLIYKSFGPSRILNGIFPTPEEALLEFENLTFADKVINWLGIITAGFVSPMWDGLSLNIQSWEMEEAAVLPKDILEVAKGLMEHKLTFEKAILDYHEIYYYSSSRFEKLIHYNTYCVYQAAESALLQVLFGKDVEREQTDSRSRNILHLGGDFVRKTEIAYSLVDTNTPGFWQAFFYRMEPVNGFVINLQKRLEFWEWWLNEAIPQAWETAQ